MNKYLIAALAATMSCTPAMASTCWKGEAVQAAQVRNFEMMLMVSALRCRTTSYDFLPAYNQFVREKRAALIEVNDMLRTHYGEAVGVAAGLDAYDDYVIQLANSYGAGVDGLACRDLQAITAAANALPPNRVAIWKLADAAGVAARIDGPRCDVVMALAKEAEGEGAGKAGSGAADARMAMSAAPPRGPAN